MTKQNIRTFLGDNYCAAAWRLNMTSPEHQSIFCSIF